ncbi:MAG: hypothetical protein GF307_08090 [candidate division Zixibacteria bacterium]|nr:hypothetical protein [candidate division Zixibacteria bacterium]
MLKKEIYRAVLLVAAIGSLFVFNGCTEDNCCDYIDNDPPAVPTGVYSVTGDEQITLYWSPVIENDFDYYVVWRSDDPVGPYEDIAETRSTYFLDSGLINGRTYYWAVSSVDIYGNESELSEEMVFDTPRPEGRATLRDYINYPDLSGYSFENQQVLGYNDQACDIYIHYDDDTGVFYVVTGRDNTDIQDMGYTDDLDDINYSPEYGWSELRSLEVVLHHTYILWTADNHFAKFRITSINSSTLSVGYDFAFQTDPGNRELRVAFDNKIKKNDGR